MTYAGTVSTLVTLRSRAMFEKAMQVRDVNGTELAALADVSVQTVSNLRRGKTSRCRAGIAAAICDVLGVEPLALFEDAEYAGFDDSTTVAS